MILFIEFFSFLKNSSTRAKKFPTCCFTKGAIPGVNFQRRFEEILDEFPPLPSKTICADIWLRRQWGKSAKRSSKILEKAHREWLKKITGCNIRPC